MSDWEESPDVGRSLKRAAWSRGFREFSDSNTYIGEQLLVVMQLCCLGSDPRNQSESNQLSPLWPVRTVTLVTTDTGLKHMTQR